ncbi:MULTISPECIES: biosynthetic-type acetolactate synthase large subunit [Paraburkholderia]|uniref:biosynthetic-type acetolactate synthase large subunit n=1 Tax=Paraburkholderia TaxID=1822464 RepID=UPI00224ED56A|nr:MULTISPECIES: biosynthetic-type acetolactate synthase large subunit [Paraburkholderia]MCX4176993.1 biosynthetic-type acetolactate synthase large subunit [Paraburkholderia madseniana]MDQ6464983.1 biosynthetic-type acetolactate synthase large subunit [Paraburkholderia madseniana]
MNMPVAEFRSPKKVLHEVISGAEMIIRALEIEGVTKIWGYPGGAVLPIYDALEQQSAVIHYLVRHEQGAVHAADGYARATGSVGVALVTSGPGITNAVTGIATAYFDSVSMVVISGNVPRAMIGQDAFQECDAIGITRPVVKHSFLVLDVGDLPTILKKAFHIARTGRPGPVLIDVPKDVALDRAAFSYPASVKIRSYRPVTDGSFNQIRNAAAMLAAAKRPYVYAGGGVVISEAHRELIELVSLLKAPVTTTLMALGAYPAHSPNFVGMLGMHGTYEANRAMQECDVLIAVGARFDDRVVGNVADFLSSGRKVIHIDIDPASIGKRVSADIPIVGDARLVLKKLNEALKTAKVHDSDRVNWWESINRWRQKRCLEYSSTGTTIKPQFVIEKLSELAGDDSFVCSDVGQHQMWTAQHYPFSRPRQWINSGGLGTMGVGLPYAMGVKAAFPESDVFTITGDGSIQMCIQELSTCRQYDLAVKVISLNNGYLGMVRQLQHVEYGQRYSQSYLEALPDFVALAKAYGHVGMRIEKPEEVEPALREAIGLKDRTVFLDFAVDPNENVWPMVRSGRGLNDMLLGDPHDSDFRD